MRNPSRLFHHAGLVAVLAASMLMAPPASAQSVTGLRVGLNDRPVASAAAPNPRPTHWQEGMLIGAGAGVVLTWWVYELANHIGDTPAHFNPFGALLLIGVCSLTGGLIGSAFPK